MFQKKIKDLDLIIFDFDGTLVDSNGVNNKIDIELVRFFEEKKGKNEILQERDYILKTKTNGDIYLNYCQYLKEKYNSDLSAKEILEIRRKLSRKFLKNVKYKPSADIMIKWLKEQKIKLALATVSSRASLKIYFYENENIREKCDIQKYFDFIITKDDVVQKKPNPEVYNKIINEFNIKDLSKCLVIEDSLSGVLAAKKANLNVIAIYDKYSDKDREEINKTADYNVKDFEELFALFKNKKEGVLK